MGKFSVKKPFTVLVAVIMVLMLGFVSISNMQTNLLPDVNTPYLMVVTVYPGASPERVESEVSDVMENALGTVAGVESITATSAENYSLLLMHFAEGTDMNAPWSRCPTRWTRPPPVCPAAVCRLRSLNTA